MNLTPKVSEIPFNSNVAFNNSWITIENDQNRPLFAQATYLTNVQDIDYQIALLINEIKELNNRIDYQIALLINEIKELNNRNGFDVIDDTDAHFGDYSILKLIADTKFADVSANNATVGNLSAYELPQGFELNGRIKGFRLEYGAVIAYKELDEYRFDNSIIGIDGKELVSMTGDGLNPVAIVTITQ
jgi:hypothetical protein